MCILHLQKGEDMMKKVICFILSIIMCLNIGFSIEVVNASSQSSDVTRSVKGKIVRQGEAEAEKTLLEGIEIKVYSSILDKNVNEADLEVYNSTYEFSVFCDAYGEYSFVPPSENFTIAVGLESLPEKTGITDITMLIKQNETIKDVALYKIDHLALQYDENNNLVTKVYSEDNCEIFALCETQDIVDISEYSFEMVNGNKSKSVPVLSREINDIRFINKNISVEVNGVYNIVPCSYNLTDMPIEEKITLLSNLGIISEQEKILLYCDLIESTSESVSLSCGTSLILELQEYCEKNKNSSDENIQMAVNKANSALRSHVGPYLQEGLMLIDIGSGNYYYQLHYEAGTGGPNSTLLASAAASIKNVHNFFVNAGFNAPKKPTGESYYHIYLVSGWSSNGTTYVQNAAGNTAASYIYLKFDAGESFNASTNKVTSLFDSFVAHEMFHAITYTYRYSMPKWFQESFATWAGLRYSENGVNVYGYVTQYLPSTSTSPEDFSSLENYGFCVFPLTLDEYNGGISTIRYIIEATANTSDAYKAIQNGITAANQRYTKIEEAFNYCSLYISKPLVFYALADSRWGEATAVSRSDTASYSVTGDSFTSSRYKYSRSSSAAKTLSITLNTTTGSRGCGLIRCKLDGTTEVVSAAASSYDLVTYNISNYGTAYTNVILSITNTSSSSDNLKCTVTSALD